MRFEFSDAQLLMRDEVRRLLADRDARKSARAVLEGVDLFDRALWADLGALGLLGATIPEVYGGVGAGYAELCLAAEELGRALAAVPFVSSIGMGADLILHHGDEVQKRGYLPDLATGARIACLAFAEGAGNPSPTTMHACVTDGRLSGVKSPVLDGAVADLAIVIAGDEDADRSGSLFLVDLRSDAVTRTSRAWAPPARAGRC
jgi:alkylation response protein AidB-like acyl-CoA dehydrogenase